jgi:hypothetical protein
MTLTALAGASGGSSSTTPATAPAGAGAAPAATGTDPTMSAPTGMIAEADIDNIINQRDSQDPAAPATLTGAWLVTVGGMDPTVFKSIEKYITGRTMVYRVQSIGYFGPVARVEAVIDTNQGSPRILYFRDLTDLPLGFDLPNQ